LEQRPQKPGEKETNRFRHGRGPQRPHDPATNPESGAARRGGPNRSRGRDERRQDQRQENTPAPAPRREPSVNLNSPFAKLLALKSQLEAKGKD